MVAAGQSASVGKGGAFAVGGKGPKPDILSEAGETVSPDDAAKGKAVAPGLLKTIGAEVKIKINGNGSANASANSAVAGSVGGNGNGNGGGNGKGKGNSASGTTP